MMNEQGKSDSRVVSTKSSNKGVEGKSPTSAEEMERRRLIKRKLQEQNTRRIQCRERVQSALKRIRDAAVKDKKQKFTALMHHIYSVDTLEEAFMSLKHSASAGIDEVMWHDYQEALKENLQALSMKLQQGAYRAKPVKRSYILKSDGKPRSLGVQALEDKIVQGATAMVLGAIYETEFLGFSYGYRPKRSQHRCLDALYVGLKTKKVNYVLDADIKGFFDSISHSWLLEKAPMDKVMLQKWLAAGYLEKGEFYPTEVGTPQGGLCSPTLLVITLSGLEEVVKKIAPNPKDKVHVCVYADDFIITGATKKVLEERVKPAVEAFLRERGLTLSLEKTKIAHINEGFDFLGVNIRKYKGKLIMRPAKSNVKRFLAEIRKTIRKNATSKAEDLIWTLNAKIRGWTNHFRHICSKKIFVQVDSEIFMALWRWAKRRHPDKGRMWIQEKYWRSEKCSGKA